MKVLTERSICTPVNKVTPPISRQGHLMTRVMVVAIENLFPIGRKCGTVPVKKGTGGRVSQLTKVPIQNPVLKGGTTIRKGVTSLSLCPMPPTSS